MGSAARCDGEESALDAFAEFFEEKGLGQAGVTHFICLKDLEHFVRHDCEVMAKDFLRESLLRASATTAESEELLRDSAGEESEISDFGSLKTSCVGVVDRVKTDRLGAFAGVMR